MKIQNWLSRIRDRSKVVTQFGSAKLVKRVNGEHELVGGTHADRLAAHEWVSIFLHEVVIREK